MKARNLMGDLPIKHTAFCLKRAPVSLLHLHQY